jgi:hypothetical protein
VIRAPKDFWSGLGFIAFGTATTLVARDYPMGSATRMGPGYFPMVLGALLALIGAIVVARSFVIAGERITEFAWKPLVYVAAATVLFGMLVRPAGLALAVVVLTVLSAFASRHFSARTALLLSLGLAVFSIVVFVKALGLPMTMFGAWLGR